MTVFYLLAKHHINLIIILTKKIKTTFLASRGMIVVFCSRDYQVLLNSIILLCLCHAALKNFFILQSNLITECSDTQTSSQHFFCCCYFLNAKDNDFRLKSFLLLNRNVHSQII